LFRNSLKLQGRVPRNFSRWALCRNRPPELKKEIVILSGAKNLSSFYVRTKNKEKEILRSAQNDNRRQFSAAHETAAHEATAIKTATMETVTLPPRLAATMPPKNSCFTAIFWLQSSTGYLPLRNS